MKHGHQVEALPLQIDSLSLQVVIDKFLLLADHFTSARNLLQQDLHHIHLAEGQALHL